MGILKQLEALQEASAIRLQSLKSIVRRIVILRVLVFLSFASALYATWWTPLLSGFLMVTGIVLFLYLIKRHVLARDRSRHEQAYYGLCSEEIDIAQGKWRKRQDGSKYIAPSHPFSSDLNIFGRHSLFQYLNRSQSPEAEALLAQWLGENLLDTEAIIQERDTIIDFSRDPDWSFRYLAHARTAFADREAAQAEDVLWTQGITTERNYAVRIFLTRLAPLAMIGITLAYAFDIMGWNAFLISLIISGAFTAAFLKRNQSTFMLWTTLASRVRAYDAMLAMLRKRNFGGSPFQTRLDNAALAESEKALKSLQSISGAIDSRNNVIVGIVLNLLLFWDFQCVYRLADWQERYGARMPLWLQLVREAEAYQSMALYRFSHPEATDVTWTDEPGIFCESATHPLLGTEAVANAIDLAGSKQFAIITGANMAGKSTYLRTVGVLAVMAMRGMPVTASNMRMSPMQLYTSMLTTDSLGDQASYFFSELKRLREIVDALESGRPHFIILDEILKGTNSVDKAEGSRLFMQKLTGLPAKGLIATHDLSLCEMAAQYPGQIENLSFEVEFEAGQLIFDYKLRKGVCQNMNASFLLKEMGLV